MDETLVKLLNIGDSIDVIVFKKDKSSVLMKSLIYEILNEKELIIASPVHEGRLYSFMLGSRQYMRFSIKNMGIYFFEGLIAGKMKFEGMHALKIVLATDIKRLQRRAFFRIPLYIDGYFRYLIPKEEVLAGIDSKYKDNPDILIEDEYDMEKFKLMDLSGGGLKLVSKVEHEIGEVLEGVFTLEDIEIVFEGEVVRSRLLDDGDYDLGIKFTDLDEQIRSFIIGYIFKKQRNQIKRGNDEL